MRRDPRAYPVVTSLRITARNARFQQWHALLDNRTKRTRAGEFVVQGVRPITLAVEHGWTIRA
ncbi:MAG TPA: rRNA methyltransferase, partial [Pseudonocardiaceae bacterium]|nr:rRNA methyltransferase [Pseudonocardiaceae bacterium]